MLRCEHSGELRIRKFGRKDDGGRPPVARNCGVIGDDPNPQTGQCIGHSPDAVNAKRNVGTLHNRENNDPDQTCAHNRGDEVSEYPSELRHGGRRRTARPAT